MSWWWEDMTLYQATKKDIVPAETGVLVTPDLRPLNHINQTLSYTCPQKMNAFERRTCALEIVDLLRSNTDRKVCITLYKEFQHIAAGTNLAASVLGKAGKAIGKFLRMIKAAIRDSRLDPKIPHSETSMLYFFYLLVMKSDFLLDYSISEFSDRYEFTLLGNV
jgi:hypothetical protein